jgi:hypothetical protein
VRIGLFIPCYIDAFFPEVSIAALELLDDPVHDKGTAFAEVERRGCHRHGHPHWQAAACAATRVCGRGDI